MVPIPEPYELFDRIREAAAQRLDDVVGRLLPRIADELTRHPGGAVSLQTEIALAQAAMVLRDEVGARRESAVATLNEFHFRSLQVTPSATRSDAVRVHGESPSSGLELVADSDLTDQIVAQALATRVVESLEEAYPAYLSRLAQLTGQPAEEDNCPLGAKALATALVGAVRPYSSHRLSRERVEAALLRYAVIPIREIIAAADSCMLENGVLSTLPRIVVSPGRLRTASEGVVAPSVSRSPEAPSGESAHVPATDRSAATRTRPPKAMKTAVAKVEPPKASAETSAAAAPARRIIRDAKAAQMLGTHPIVGTQDGRSAFRQAELLPAIDSLERDAIAFAHQVGHPPFSTPARQEFFSQLREQMRAAGVSAAQVATLELVATMFDYAEDHDRIPDPARPLLWRLQLPAVTLACMDPGYLSDGPRSIRRLVEHVAAIATAYPDDIARGSELYARLHTVVRAVEVVAHAFQVRSQVLSERVKIEYQRANHGVGQLLSRVTRERLELESNTGRRNRRDYRHRPSREREFEISDKLEKMLVERLQDRQVPESVEEFLKGVWLRHLRTAVLRDGEESAGYRAALAVVDDLLWTLDGEGQRRSRSELAQRIPPMLRILTQGISDIGAHAEDYRPFFDEMFLIHLRRMQRRPKPGKDSRASVVNDLPVLSDQVPAPSAQNAPVAASEPLRSAAAIKSPPVRADEPVANVLPKINELRDINVPRKTEATEDVVEAAEDVDLDDDEPPMLELPPPVADVPAAKPPERRAEAKSTVASDGFQGNDARAASELKLRRLIDNTSLDDLPRRPVRLDIAPADLVRDLAPGQWLELITSSRRKILAKVAWLNDRRSVALLLQHPNRLILSRHVSALRERAEAKRVFRVE